MGSPPCTAFSQLFSTNISRMDPKDVRNKIREGLTHLLFFVLNYIIFKLTGVDFSFTHIHGHPGVGKFPKSRLYLNVMACNVSRGTCAGMVCMLMMAAMAGLNRCLNRPDGVAILLTFYLNLANNAQT